MACDFIDELGKSPTVTKLKEVLGLQVSDWIYPTYVNGFTDDSSSWRSRYRKIGRQVEVHINVKNGADNSIILNLQSGFRPPFSQGAVLSSSTGYKKLQIRSDGSVYLKGTVDTWINGVVLFNV